MQDLVESFRFRALERKQALARRTLPARLEQEYVLEIAITTHAVQWPTYYRRFGRRWTRRANAAAARYLRRVRRLVALLEQHEFAARHLDLSARVLKQIGVHVVHVEVDPRVVFEPIR